MSPSASSSPAKPSIRRFTGLDWINSILYSLDYGADNPDIKRLFGYQDKSGGEPSRLHVSWGALQDSQGQPVEGLWLG